MEHVDGIHILDLLETAGPERLRTVQHLLVCARCRAKALELRSPALRGDDSGLARLAGRIWPRVVRQLRERAAAEERDCEHAGPLYDELMELAADRRWEAVALEDRFRAPGVARWLLAATEEAIESDPARAETLAELALAIAHALDDSLEDSIKVELQGQALTWIAETRRLRGLFERAENAFLSAARRLDEAPLVSLERGLFCRLFARLRADQNRMDEALALLARAAALFAEMEELEELGETLCDQGFLLLEELDAESALRTFEEALPLLEPRTRPRALLRARYGLALACADLGRRTKAGNVFAENRDLDSVDA